MPPNRSLSTAAWHPLVTTRSRERGRSAAVSREQGIVSIGLVSRPSSRTLPAQVRPAIKVPIRASLWADKWNWKLEMPSSTVPAVGKRCECSHVTRLISVLLLFFSSLRCGELRRASLLQAPTYCSFSTAPKSSFFARCYQQRAQSTSPFARLHPLALHAALSLFSPVLPWLEG